MEQKDIVVSIIIPIYNGSRYLDRCIKAIMQEYQEGIEILLVDDGSVDDSLDKCVWWSTKFKCINVFHHDNHGVSYTRNRGIKESHGRYIWFVDVDDVILADSIKSILKLIREQYPDIILFGYRSKLARKQLNEFDTNPLKEGRYYIEQIIRELFWDLYRKNLIHNIGNKVYCKELILKNEIQFDESISIYEDATFCVQAMRASREMCVCAKAWYCYNLEDNLNSLNHIYRKNFFWGITQLYENISILFENLEESFYTNYLNSVLAAIKNEFRRKKYKYKNFCSFIREIMRNDNVQKALEMVTIDSMTDGIWWRLLKRRYAQCYLILKIENASNKVVASRLMNEVFDISYCVYKKVTYWYQGRR